jgi:hypothetical protein
MTTETTMATEPGQDTTVEEKISQLRELFADAPEVGKTALEKVLSRLASDASQKPPPPVQSAFRAVGQDNAIPDGFVIPFYLNDRILRISVVRAGPAAVAWGGEADG